MLARVTLLGTEVLTAPTYSQIMQQVNTARIVARAGLYSWLRAGQTILGLPIAHTPTEPAVSGARVAHNARATSVPSHAVREVILLFR